MPQLALRPDARFRALLLVVAISTPLTAQVGPFDPPLEHLSYLKATNTDAADLFGFALDLDGETLVIGAPLEDSAAAGVGGDQIDDTAPSAGAAYVFFRDNEAWRPQAYLKSPAPDAGDEFGRAVASSGNRVLIGAEQEDSAASGVDGDPADDSLDDAGAAYVYVRDGAAWALDAYLKPLDPGEGNRFGRSVALAGDLAVVGSPFGDPGPGGALSGSAYVFSRASGTWQQVAKLEPSNPSTGDRFGQQVDVWGERIVVGAPYEDGPGGAPALDTVSAAGAAYVFELVGGVWTQTAYLKAPDPDEDDEYGFDVAIWEDLVVVGAPHADSGTLGVGGDAFDNSRINTGSVFVYRRHPGGWADEAHLQQQIVDNHADFGDTVDVFAGRIVVGTHRNASNVAGVHTFPPPSGGAEGIGAAWLFERIGSCWSHRAFVKATNPEESDGFASRVAISGDTLVANAPGEDSASLALGGNPNDNSAQDAGSVYVLALRDPEPSPWSDRGCAKAGISRGDPRLVADGELTTGSSNSLTLSNAIALGTPKTRILFVGFSSMPTAFKGGTLLPVPWLLAKPLLGASDGGVELPYVMPGGVPSGTALWLQFAVYDVSALGDVALSNAVRGVTP